MAPEAWIALGIHGKGIPRMHGFETWREKRLGEQHEDVVRAVSERDLLEFETVPVCKLRAQAHDRRLPGNDRPWQSHARSQRAHAVPRRADSRWTQA
jgi:hypothetical protein